MSETLQASQLRLGDWGVIRAQGADAASFLHGQLTQDFALLDRDHARLAGFCTAKGRLLATMVGWRGGDEEILLALPAETLAATLKRLSMFVMRAKCKLTDASAEFAVYGLLGAPTAEAWTLVRDGDAVQIALPAEPEFGRALRVQPASSPAPAGAVMSPDDWAFAEAAAGMAWVRGATVEAFVPQMINFEVLGGVNFKKGCYPGQEIVARSQYRGTLKRRLQVFETQGTVEIGQEIFNSADPEQPAGVVAGSGSRDGRSVIAAEIKLAALEGGSLHLGSATGATLQHCVLPYDIPPQD
ncbi:MULTISPECIES: folate-binding protein YgfZ [unclassified Roseateles]|uniref:CAF17-like 4Fe-4S cluster assembly/insertion protein YgfZ n=1 Tax=unclassified Roseateles TaxID=2626991 RepID=UPI0006FD4372|nr:MULTISPECIES: folate-binding protein YgfZ [unclassified Roseateles]KQW43358.1 folate-binding protein [Pelomonas sp. Root405]KRA71096.1 folate-binding protein [Pelomonas sp. Root662]